MANIRLKELVEANVDPKLVARSKESGKLVYFKTPQAKADALKAGSHIDPKAKKGEQPKVDAKPNDMFGGDYAKDRGGETPKADLGVDKVVYNTRTKTVGIVRMADERGETKTDADGNVNTSELEPYNPLKYPHQKDAKVAPSTQKEVDARGLWNPFAQTQTSAPLTHDSKVVKALSSKTGVSGRAAISWAEKNGVDLTKIASDVESKKLNPMDFMTAVAGNTGNKYAKDIISKYSQGGGETPNADIPKVNLPKKASKLNYKHAEALEKAVNDATGLNGYVDTDDNTDAIQYHGSNGAYPTYTLYFGGNDDYNKPDEFRVSLLPTYDNDPSNLGDGKIDKTFKSGDDAMKFMVAVAKKYKKELEMDDNANESSKLTSMLRK